MQDVDDFDPLDDILLSDEDLPEPKTPELPLYQKVKDSDPDGELKKEKKKKIIAELFGTEIDETPKGEDKSSAIITASTSKSDWLKLKDDDGDPVQSTSATTAMNTIHDSSTNIHVSRSITGSKTPSFRESSAELESGNSRIDRRRSAADRTSDLQKSKQRFKSLDLDLFDFDSSVLPKTENSTLTEVLEKDDDKGNSVSDANRKDADNKGQENSYVPSSHVTRRYGLGQSRSRPIRSEQRNWLSSLTLENPQNKPVTDTTDNSANDPLPTWLKPNKKESTNLDFFNQREEIIKSKPAIPKSDVETDDFIESRVQNEGNENEDETAARDTNIKKEYEDEEPKKAIGKGDKIRTTPSVAVLKEKKDRLKRLAENQSKTMTLLEQEIRDTAFQLIREQRDQQRESMKALLQILSFDGVLNDKTSSIIDTTLQNENKNVEKLENAISQLQMELNKVELEKSEFVMKLKYAERKRMIDLAMLEDIYKCKLQVAEEKEEYYIREIQALEEEYDKKFVKRKEEEDELIRAFNEKIKILKEEHLDELKHIAEVQTLRNPWKSLINVPQNSEMKSTVDKELVLREIAVEEKHKELLEFEERLSRQKQSLDTKEISLNARIEDLEIKIAKEKLQIEQEKKDLKLAQTMFEEKQVYSQRELQREKERVTSYKQELEVMKEHVLKEEGKLMKEKFEICAERARIEAIVSTEGYHGGQTRDIIQSRAELQGTIDELSRLKSKLESERNEVKLEHMRLKEEGWRLREIEQELRQQQKNSERILRESEIKREEGVEALKKALKIENQFDERAQELEKRAMELNRKEDLLTQEKLELSKDRDLLVKKRHQLDMLLPQLTYEEQMPFNLLNKNLFDPRITMMKLRTDNLLNE